MIRIDRDLELLREQVTALKPTWHARAAKRTAANRDAGRNLYKKGIWSEIKQLFITLQRSKCSYCERDGGTAGIEWAIDHFRPANSAENWPTRSAKVKPPGYHLLAFNLENYLLACDVCNSVYKSDYFPVAGKRRLGTDDPALLRTERPLLINPLDAGDVDPSSLITFLGPTPQPVAPFGPDRERALVVIDLLNLNRDDLVVDRSKCLISVWIAYRSLSLAPEEDAFTRWWLQKLAGPAGQYISCVRAFLQLCESDRAEAERLIDAMKETVDANSPIGLPGVI